VVAVAVVLEVSKSKTNSNRKVPSASSGQALRPNRGLRMTGYKDFQIADAQLILEKPHLDCFATASGPHFDHENAIDRPFLFTRGTSALS
jgi:hypothetical protein